MKILDKWGVQAGAITNPKINGAIELGSATGVLSTRPPVRPGRPDDIGAVPVRRPGPLGRGRDRAGRRGRADPLGRDQPALRMGASSATTCSTTRILEGLRGDARADGDRDGDRHRARRAARGHAPVAQPARLGCELALHLVLPRHAGAGAAAVLVQHRRAVPEDRARDPVRPGLRAPGREHADHRRSPRRSSASG